MKKLCFVINTDWYFDLHWIERALAAQNRGYEVHLITYFEDEALRSKLISTGIICHNIPLAGQSYNPLSLLVSYYELTKILNKIKPHIIHCITIKASLMGGFYSRIYKSNAILSFAGLGRVFASNNKSFSFLRQVIVYIYRFICCQNKIKLLFEHEKDRDDFVRITSIDINKTLIIRGAGVNTEHFSYQREVLTDVTIILFASRLLWSKGLKDLVDITRSLVFKGINVRLDVAGIITKDDSDAIPLHVIEKWHSEGLINWLGKSNDVASLIAHSHIVVLPSVYPEGIPRILLEASACGRACISYDSGGCDCLIRDGINGYIIPKGNVKSLSDAIEILLKNPSMRQRMGIKGREIVLNEFSSELVMRQTVELYNSL